MKFWLDLSSVAKRESSKIFPRSQQRKSQDLAKQDPSTLWYYAYYCNLNISRVGRFIKFWLDLSSVAKREGSKIFPRSQQRIFNYQMTDSDVISRSFSSRSLAAHRCKRLEYLQQEILVSKLTNNSILYTKLTFEKSKYHIYLDETSTFHSMMPHEKRKFYLPAERSSSSRFSSREQLHSRTNFIRFIGQRLGRFFVVIISYRSRKESSGGREALH